MLEVQALFGGDPAPYVEAFRLMMRLKEDGAKFHIGRDMTAANRAQRLALQALREQGGMLTADLLKLMHAYGITKAEAFDALRDLGIELDEVTWTNDRTRSIVQLPDEEWRLRLTGCRPEPADVERLKLYGSYVRQILLCRPSVCLVELDRLCTEYVTARWRNKIVEIHEWADMYHADRMNGIRQYLRDKGERQGAEALVALYRWLCAWTSLIDLYEEARKKKGRSRAKENGLVASG